MLREEPDEDELEPFYYHYDGIGSVTALTDDEGEIEARYTYDAFGNTLSIDGDDITNPYRFSTKEHNPKSHLIYFGARYYDPRIGRFITKDPYQGDIFFLPLRTDMRIVPVILLTG